MRISAGNAAHEPLQWPEMDARTRAIAYSPSSALDTELDVFLRQYSDRSATAYAAFPDTRTLAYGEKPTQTIDLVVPKASAAAPLLVFIHGGYWQELSKHESFGAAPDALARGFGYAAIDYTLAPDAGIDQIVQECHDALVMLFEQATNLGVDPARIILAGSSAGAHLAAMVALTLPPGHRLCGLALLSGIYWLEPLIGTYVNDALGLDLETATRNSPGLCKLDGLPPAVVAWGEIETGEFKRQSRLFAHQLSEAGVSVQAFEVPHRNHFDIIDDPATDTRLGQTILALGQE